VEWQKRSPPAGYDSVPEIMAQGKRNSYFEPKLPRPPAAIGMSDGASEFSPHWFFYPRYHCPVPPAAPDTIGGTLFGGWKNPGRKIQVEDVPGPAMGRCPAGEETSPRFNGAFLAGLRSTFQASGHRPRISII